jgi:hypothetical protein
MDNFKTVTFYPPSCVTEIIYETERRMLPAGRRFVSSEVKVQCVYISCYNKKITLSFILLVIVTVSWIYIINFQYVNQIWCMNAFVIHCYIQYLHSPRDYQT